MRTKRITFVYLLSSFFYQGMIGYTPVTHCCGSTTKAATAVLFNRELVECTVLIS